ncbi:hypothetical protein Zmor_008591 [Zophobas morio]|uniref:Odorant receptor n=1 Tax=Zophobas morio TaxID=2755281 RepID=A0AA38MR21_9CUCU|nr:hypothetical protein Zmor_008591 [Zophobas morio]
MENPTKESFVIIRRIMQIIRWYPPEKKSTLYLAEGYTIHFLLLVLVTSLVAVEMYLEKGYDDLVQVMYLCETICYSIKVLPFLNGNDRIKKCISFFDGEEFRPRDYIEEEILNQSVFLCQVMSKFYIVSIICAEIAYAFPALLADKFELPIPIWLPYSATSNSLIYGATYLYLVIAVVYSGFATSLLDPLIGGLTFQAVSRLKILKHRIQNPENVAEHTSNKILLPSDIYQELASCIELHNAILKFVNEYEECFSWSIFNQLVATTYVLCFICIAFTTLPLVSMESVKYVIFFFVVNGQILFYCYFGTLLYEESDSLVTAIYLSRWYEYPVESQKLLVTLMQRSQKPMILSAEKLVDLTLLTFTTILKRSYSLVALLQ